MARKLIRIILLLSVVFSFTNLQASGNQELVYVVNNEPELYDPGISNETFAQPVIMNAFEGLVKLDEIGDVIPAAAKSWKISDDGLTYTFHIRKNAKWADGKDLTADDFSYAWKRVLNPKTGAKYTDLLFYIKNAKNLFEGKAKETDVGIRVVDSKTIQIELDNITPHMLQIMTFWVYCPVRQDMIEKDPEGWSRKADLYLGNGPFRVTEMNFGKSVVLMKNNHYWRSDSIKLEKITFRMIPEISTALAAIEAGDVDGIEEVPAAEIPRLQVESKEFASIPALGSTYAFFNKTRKPLDDVRVRKALALAIDRSEIIEFVLQSGDEAGLGMVPYGLGLGGEDFRESGSTYGLSENADIETAQKYLAEAGFPGGKDFPSLTYKYYSNPRVKKLVEAIQQMWKKNLNIDVKIATSEWKVYYPEIRALDYDIAQMGWGADYPHPLTFLDVFLSSNPGNVSSWSDPEYDRLVDLSKKTTDVKKSLEYMHGAEDVLMNDMGILTMYFRSYSMMMGSHVKGWRRSALGAIIFEDAYIEK